MSQEGVSAFLERVLNDEGFRTRLMADADEALSQFDLTDEEVLAIKTGGEERLKNLALDARLSK